MRYRQILGTALAATALYVVPPAASASIGTGVSAMPLSLTRPTPAGSSYSFPRLYVKNTGTVTATYAIHLQRLSPGSQKIVPTPWVQVRPRRLRLTPKAIGAVAVVVALPAGASPGRYMTDLIASTYALHKPGAPSLGAAAADRLTFMIPARGAFPWWLVGIGGAIAGLLALLLLARSKTRPNEDDVGVSSPLMVAGRNRFG